MFCSYSLCEALAEQQKAAEEAEEAKLKASQLGLNTRALFFSSRDVEDTAEWDASPIA